MDELAEGSSQNVEQQLVDQAEPDLVTVKSAPRKRKARDDGQPAQPRRLTRSHEACARCRRKKSKCDSKHPSCSACLTAGVECVQEDRYRQTLKPRGYTDLLEAQIDKCAALLNKFIPGFKLEYLDYHLSNYGVALQPQDAGQATQFLPAYLTAEQLAAGEGMEGYDPAAAAAAAAAGAPYPPAGAYAAGVDANGEPRAEGEAGRGAGEQTIARQLILSKGSDPMANDMSSTVGLVTAFGISKSLTKGLKQDSTLPEDLLSGVPHSRFASLSKPHDPAAWSEVPIPRARLTQDQRPLFLPGDRAIAEQVLTTYFTELNPYHPIFEEADFREKLDFLYAATSSDPVVRNQALEEGGGETGKFKGVVDDSGFIASVYLVFSLGTLSILNTRLANAETVEEVWPSHDEFYEHAIACRPEFQNTITTLQTLLALHWYLYTEVNGRHDKALWRFVGNVIRLAVELGLHHDPQDQKGPDQKPAFTPAECQLRMRLWLICLVSDRATSIVFGRPLAVQRADYSTPLPSRVVKNDKGEDVEYYKRQFEHVAALLNIQGDIVNSLYRPAKLTGEQIVLRAIEIERSIDQWRRSMPSSIRRLFGRPSEGLDRQQQSELVMGHVTTDRGALILEYCVLRLYVLRSLFNNRLISAHVRHKALHDAVITAHNVLVIQAQLTSFPESSFFVSPIPVHVAAMVILFAAISKVETLAWGLAKEDVSLALKLVPHFRWRWQRQEGSHALILRLATKVFGGMNVGQGPISPPMLLDEMYWLSDAILKSDSPPRIEDVWNQPSPGSTEAKPLPVGLGDEHHEQKLAQKTSATLGEQEAQFVAATEAIAVPSSSQLTSTSGSGAPTAIVPPSTTTTASAVGTLMDIDQPSTTRVADENYEPEDVQALLSHLTDPHPESTQPNKTPPRIGANGPNDTSLFLASGSAATADGTDSGEYYDVWSKDDGTVAPVVASNGTGASTSSA